MAFWGLPETSKMLILVSIVHHLRSNNVNVYVSEITQVGLFSGIAYTDEAYIWDANWVTYLGCVCLWGLIYGGSISEILRYSSSVMLGSTWYPSLSFKKARSSHKVWMEFCSISSKPTKGSSLSLSSLSTSLSEMPSILKELVKFLFETAFLTYNNLTIVDRIDVVAIRYFFSKAEISLRTVNVWLLVH